MCIAKVINLDLLKYFTFWNGGSTFESELAYNSPLSNDIGSATMFTAFT
jgi:hypothetical protein